MVSALVLVLVFGVLQLGLVLLVRNTLLDSAASGARYAALAGNTPADGARRTRSLIGTSLGTLPAAVDSGVVEHSGRSIAVVTVRAPVPVVGLWGPGDGLEVSAHALEEDAAD